MVWAPQASQSSNSSSSAQRHRGADAAIDALHVLQAIGVSFIDQASRLGGPIDGTIVCWRSTLKICSPATQHTWKK